jgi:hypothetical protein
MAITIFDHLKNITTIKGEFLGDEGWNSWMINKFLSMDQDYCEAVNLVQKASWQIKPEHLYNIYKDLIPKRYVYLKYIKAKNKKEYDHEEVEIISQFFEVSKKTAKYYIDILSKKEIELILEQVKGRI